MKDDNFVNPIMGVLNTDGKTIISIKGNPSNHSLKISDGTSGSDNGPENAIHNENDIPTLLATSSSDGETPIAIYCDSNGNILINSM